MPPFGKFNSLRAIAFRLRCGHSLCFQVFKRVAPLPSTFRVYCRSSCIRPDHSDGVKHSSYFTSLATAYLACLNYINPMSKCSHCLHGRVFWFITCWSFRNTVKCTSAWEHFAGWRVRWWYFSSTKAVNLHCMELQKQSVVVMAFECVEKVIIGAYWVVTFNLIISIGISLLVYGSHHFQGKISKPFCDMKDAYTVRCKLGTSHCIYSIL